MITHADGTGTKSALAYLYWKETGDIKAFEGLATDLIAMNIDDMACVGATGPLTYVQTIGRNKNLIPGEVIDTIISATQRQIEMLRENFGIEIYYHGGETADLGNLVRTIVLDATMQTRMLRSEVINTAIVPGSVIVGMSSSGHCIYEQSYNSGMASNGLTSAIHDMLTSDYLTYPETYDPIVAGKN
jgi:phosphoribosylformylglycinamidine cyclo-ligase